ncbi:MAG: rhomboid family intramembrane serine protease [Planctomycetaceae bacterium]
MAGISCSLNLLFSLRGSGGWGWRGVLCGLLLTLVICVKTIPHHAGHIVGAGWFLLVILPGLVQYAANRLLAGRRYRAALVLAKISAWLHPFDLWPDHPEIIRALRCYHEGRTAEATAMINRLGRPDSALGRLAVMMEAQQTGDWEQFLHWVQSHDSESARHDENLLLGRLQALGELGRRQEMLHAYQQFLGADEDADAESVGAVALRVAALSGLPEAVDLLTDAMSSLLPKDVEKYWRLTARQVAGIEDATDGFRTLQASASRYLDPMIARRIAKPLPPIVEGELDEAAARTREQLRARVAHETRYAVMDQSSRRRPYATWSIAVLLIAVFFREIPGGSSNLGNLFQLGALVIPTSFTPGQPWRMLTAGFLHFGPLHLAMNLLGLFYLGSRLERTWGRVRTIVCYLTATFMSMGLAPMLVTPPPSQPFVILVGASGGVMGLLGAIIGHLTVGWWRGRSRRVSRQLGMLLLLVTLQTSFDLSTPNVSFACHLLGLTTGFVFSVVLGIRTRHRPVT